MKNNQHFALSSLHFALCTRRRVCATALIETAIVLPLYMIVLYGLLYFGFATLGRQRQDKATAYAAWATGTQDAGSLVNQFWSLQLPVPNNPVSFDWTSPGTTNDTTVSVYGGSTTAQWTRQGDEYYGMEKFVTPQGVTQWLLPGSPNYNTYYNYNDNINANIVVYTPYQLAGFHTIWGGGTEIFDRERVSVDLWNYALGSYRQSFNWVPGQGIVQQFIWQGTDFSNYLNIDSTFNQQQHGGLLHADDLTPPTLVGPDGTYAGLTCAALNGSPGAGPWLQRRAVESTMTYNDPLFLRYAYADQGAPPSTFGQYIAGNTAAPTNATWMTATMDCDVTIRTDSMRYAAGEGSQTSDTLLTQVLGVLGAQYQPPQWSQVEKPLLALPTVNGKWEPN